jgi:hypothetical protein
MNYNIFNCLTLPAYCLSFLFFSFAGEVQVPPEYTRCRNGMEFGSRLYIHTLS